MARLGSRSLNGLVTIARSAMLSDHQALELLNSCDCNITSSGGRIIIREDTFLLAAKAAKHPQYAAFGSFFGRFENARHLLSLLGERDGGSRISYDRWLQACMELRRGFTWHSEVPAEKPCLTMRASIAVSRNQTASKDKLMFVRAKLKELLYKYRYQHPWVMIFLPPLYRNLFYICSFVHALPFHMFYPILLYPLHCLWLVLCGDY